MQTSSNGQIKRSLRTRLAHAGERRSGSILPMSEPIYQNSVYGFADSVEADRAFAEGRPLYARDGMPNVRSLERAVADLEGAEDAVAVSSGMAAIAMSFLALLESGDHVVIGCEGYCDTGALLTELGRKFELRVSRVNLNDRDALQAVLTPATKLIFAETISNPGLRLADLPAIASAAREFGALLIVDNTFATPALCRPIEFGADLVVHSAGKFLGGHHDTTAGVVVGSRELIARIRRSTYLYGPLLAPMEAWLIMRGMKTLAPRMEWSSRSAMIVANWLIEQPAVEAVRYPGRSDSANQALANRMLPRGAGGVLAFDLRDGESAALALLPLLTTIPYVPSVGGTTTIASFPPRSPAFDGEGEPVMEPYRSATIRLSVGLEDPAEIIADLDRALVALPSVDQTRSLA
ncbi:MAG: trans-sulfuration enzyme family protein [Thermomicrobiales bacterium]